MGGSVSLIDGHIDEDIERCENCAYCAKLAHNFRKVTGFEYSRCCVQFTDYVVEVSANGRCESFTRRESA